MNFFEKVYQVVREVPVGKVTTYGQIARRLGTRDARRVGHALHANRDPQTPCHRVVNREGRLAMNFAFDGPGEQRRRLLGEGVKFLDKFQVDLDKSLMQE